MSPPFPAYLTPMEQLRRTGHLLCDQRDAQGRVATNSVKAVRKPRQRSRRVRPLAPITVETIRTKLGRRDATLVSVLAYAGLRPGEALGLQWHNVRDRTLLVNRSVSLGREKAPRPTPPAPSG